MLLVFNKERLVFDARDFLDEFETSIINLPISIEIKYFDGVAPCGLALLIEEVDLEAIENILNSNEIMIKYVFTGGRHDKEYKKLR